FIGGFHEYMKYLKYGYGRSTDQMCFEIRAGRMTREEAVKKVGQYEGKIPWKHIPEFLEYLNITQKDFLDNFDRFTNRKLFLCDAEGKLVKDADGNLIRKYPVV
ncbi:MAG: N-acetyl sugar amidotransferase, partial [Candidatus Omnitrophota bacterium]